MVGREEVQRYHVTLDAGEEVQTAKVEKKPTQTKDLRGSRGAKTEGCICDALNRLAWGKPNTGIKKTRGELERQTRIEQTPPEVVPMVEYMLGRIKTHRAREKCTGTCWFRPKGTKKSARSRCPIKTTGVGRCKGKATKKPKRENEVV